MTKLLVLKDEENYTTFTVDAGTTKAGTFLCGIEIMQGDEFDAPSIMLDITDISRLKRIIKFVEQQEKKWFLAMQKEVK